MKHDKIKPPPTEYRGGGGIMRVKPEETYPTIYLSGDMLTLQNPVDFDLGKVFYEISIENEVVSSGVLVDDQATNSTRRLQINIAPLKQGLMPNDSFILKLSRKVTRHKGTIGMCSDADVYATREEYGLLDAEKDSIPVSSWPGSSRSDQSIEVPIASYKFTYTGDSWSPALMSAKEDDVRDPEFDPNQIQVKLKSPPSP